MNLSARGWRGIGGRRSTEASLIGYVRELGVLPEVLAQRLQRRVSQGSLWTLISTVKAANRLYVYNGRSLLAVQCTESLAPVARGKYF